jgi:aspartokinase-like uncharacterized kinase
MIEPVSDLVIVKVGGSLYELPELASKLEQWLASLATSHVLLIPGGGSTADLVRAWDRLHDLGEERSHWLAIQALTLNANFLERLLKNARVVASLAECGVVWKSRTIPILDPRSILEADEGNPDRLPHTWDATSDSVAARVAILARAKRLILLKSADIDPKRTWDALAADGLVDPVFPKLAAGLCPVQVVNFRNCHPAPPSPASRRDV